MSQGYIQADVLGRKRGLKFGMPACRHIMLEAHNLNAKIGETVDVVLIPVVIYWGLWNNCYVKREEPDFTFEEVCDWVDDNLQNTEVFTDIFKCFYESKVVNMAFENLAKEDEKKSSTLRQSEDGTSLSHTSEEKSEPTDGNV